MKKIGIITINFNTEELLEKLISCLRMQTFGDWKLVIVNNSPDNIKIEKVIGVFNDKRIMLIGENKNIGYSKGNNYGFKYLINNKVINGDDIILFTNEDIVIDDPDFLQKAVNDINNLRCGFLGPRIINDDGTMMLPHVKPIGFIKCLLHMGNNGKVDRFFRVNKGLSKRLGLFRVFLLNGACFFCRAKDFKAVGLFDINTFIYCEEELIFRKVLEKKIEVFYNADLIVYHKHSASVKKSFSILNKKRFVYDGELYFLSRILKINRFQSLMFRSERWAEISILSYILKIRDLKNKIFKREYDHNTVKK